jgi:hypothetical protein
MNQAGGDDASASKERLSVCRNVQTSANLTLRQFGGSGFRLIAPECVTPTRVEPAPWCHPSRQPRQDPDKLDAAL